MEGGSLVAIRADVVPSESLWGGRGLQGSYTEFFKAKMEQRDPLAPMDYFQPRKFLVVFLDLHK